MTSDSLVEQKGEKALGGGKDIEQLPKSVEPSVNSDESHGLPPQQDGEKEVGSATQVKEQSKDKGGEPTEDSKDNKNAKVKPVVRYDE